MRYLSKSAFALLVFGATLLLVNPTNWPESYFTEAEARVGRPLTPVSVGGVARRSTRRSIYATSAATTAAVATTAVVASQPVTVVQQPVTVVEQPASLPVGSTLPSLPSGCNSTTINNSSYFTCGGNWYKPAMQGGNVVYTVVTDPQ
ncbi:MAG: hypothetical protein ACN4GR_01300 [Arenicellales bacterium]